MYKSRARAFLSGAYIAFTTAVAALFMVRQRVAVVADAALWYDSLVPYGLYVLLALLLLCSACIVLALYARTLSARHFFFIAALASAVPLMVMRAYFYFVPTIAEESVSVLRIYARMYSVFYIAMTLCWFFSALVERTSFDAHVVLIFLCLLIISVQAGMFGTVIYGISPLPDLYVGGEAFFAPVALVVYGIIALLYFLNYANSNVRQRIAFYQFCVITLFTASTQLLLFANVRFLIFIEGGVMAASALLHLRRYFVRAL